MDETRVVMLTALGVEYEAVRALLTHVTGQPHPAGTRFEVGRTRRRGCTVVLALTGKGNHPAAVLAERAIAQFEPAAVLFVGVAGALQERVALGDIVVATHVYAYHGGASEDDGLKARPRVWEASHSMDQLARHVDRAGGWTAELDREAARPTVHFGPIAAGEVVHYSAVSGEARWIRDHYNDAVAVEMEAAGMAQAAHLNNALAAVVVRGISDRADTTKSIADRVGWQQRAVANAAAFAMALAEEIALSRSDVDRPGSGQADDAMSPASGHVNIATGNARVGVQAGTIYGGVRLRSEPPAPADLTALVADLRDGLGRAARAGLLDPPVHQAAEAELQLVTEAIAAGSEENRSKLNVALRRLRGLIGDIADLGAKIATVIAAVTALK